MSHYAKVLNGKVISVIAAEADFFTTFTDTSPGTWLQTSYNTRNGTHYAVNSNEPDSFVALRGNYAGIGYTYDASNDVFYPPKPFDSWTISAPKWTWAPPAPYPTDDQRYGWDEPTKAWVLIK